MKRALFVTFSIPMLFTPTIKIAVECEDMEQAKAVARDAYSMAGVKNIRFRFCGKPKRKVVSYSDYWCYTKWL